MPFIFSKSEAHDVSLWGWRVCHNRVFYKSFMLVLAGILNFIPLFTNAPGVGDELVDSGKEILYTPEVQKWLEITVYVSIPMFLEIILDGNKLKEKGCADKEHFTTRLVVWCAFVLPNVLLLILIKHGSTISHEFVSRFWLSLVPMQLFFVFGGIVVTAFCFFQDQENKQQQEQHQHEQYQRQYIGSRSSWSWCYSRFVGWALSRSTPRGFQNQKCYLLSCMVLHRAISCIKAHIREELIENRVLHLIMLVVTACLVGQILWYLLSSFLLLRGHVHIVGRNSSDSGGSGGSEWVANMCTLPSLQFTSHHYLYDFWHTVVVLLYTLAVCGTYIVAVAKTGYGSLMFVAHVYALMLYLQMACTVLLTIIPGRAHIFSAAFERARLESRLNLIRYVSHEMRTPLNTATMGLNIIHAELDHLHLLSAQLARSSGAGNQRISTLDVLDEHSGSGSGSGRSKDRNHDTVVCAFQRAPSFHTGRERELQTVPGLTPILDLSNSSSHDSACSGVGGGQDQDHPGGKHAALNPSHVGSLSFSVSRSERERPHQREEPVVPTWQEGVEGLSGTSSGHGANAGTFSRQPSSSTSSRTAVSASASLPSTLPLYQSHKQAGEPPQQQQQQLSSDASSVSTASPTAAATAAAVARERAMATQAASQGAAEIRDKKDPGATSKASTQGPCTPSAAEITSTLHPQQTQHQQAQQHQQTQQLCHELQLRVRDVTETVEQVGEACYIAVSTLDDLLTFDKLDERKLEVALELIDAQQFVLDAVRPFRINAREAHIALVVQFIGFGSASGAHSDNKSAGTGDGGASVLSYSRSLSRSHSGDELQRLEAGKGKCSQSKATKDDSHQRTPQPRSGNKGAVEEAERALVVEELLSDNGLEDLEQGGNSGDDSKGVGGGDAEGNDDDDVLVYSRNDADLVHEKNEANPHPKYSSHPIPTLLPSNASSQPLHPSYLHTGQSHGAEMHHQHSHHSLSSVGSAASVYAHDAGAGGGAFSLLRADKFKLSQVLRNLVSNALKFTPAGGAVTITIQREANEDPFRSGIPRVGPLGSSHLLRLVVQDTGAGISAANQKKLFGQYVQFNPNQLQKGGGSGLGLWISKSIVDLHGGTIRCESPGEGLGTAFTLDLPLFGPPSAPDAQVAAAAAGFPTSYGPGPGSNYSGSAAGGGMKSRQLSIASGASSLQSPRADVVESHVAAHGAGVGMGEELVDDAALSIPPTEEALRRLNVLTALAGRDGGTGIEARLSPTRAIGIAGIGAQSSHFGNHHHHHHHQYYPAHHNGLARFNPAVARYSPGGGAGASASQDVPPNTPLAHTMGAHGNPPDRTLSVIYSESSFNSDLHLAASERPCRMDDISPTSVLSGAAAGAGSAGAGVAHEGRNQSFNSCPDFGPDPLDDLSPPSVRNLAIIRDRFNVLGSRRWRLRRLGSDIRRDDGGGGGGGSSKKSYSHTSSKQNSPKFLDNDVTVHSPGGVGLLSPAGNTLYPSYGQHQQLQPSHRQPHFFPPNGGWLGPPGPPGPHGGRVHEERPRTPTPTPSLEQASVVGLMSSSVESIGPFPSSAVEMNHSSCSPSAAQRQLLLPDGASYTQPQHHAQQSQHRERGVSAEISQPTDSKGNHTLSLSSNVSGGVDSRADVFNGSHHTGDSISFEGAPSAARRGSGSGSGVNAARDEQQPGEQLQSAPRTFMSYLRMMDAVFHPSSSSSKNRSQSNTTTAGSGMAVGIAGLGAPPLQTQHLRRHGGHVSQIGHRHSSTSAERLHISQIGQQASHRHSSASADGALISQVGRRAYQQEKRQTGQHQVGHSYSYASSAFSSSTGGTGDNEANTERNSLFSTGSGSCGSAKSSTPAASGASGPPSTSPVLSHASNGMVDLDSAPSEGSTTSSKPQPMHHHQNHQQHHSSHQPQRRRSNSTSSKVVPFHCDNAEVMVDYGGGAAGNGAGAGVGAGAGAGIGVGKLIVGDVSRQGSGLIGLGKDGSLLVPSAEQDEEDCMHYGEDIGAGLLPRTPPMYHINTVSATAATFADTRRAPSVSTSPAAIDTTLEAYQQAALGIGSGPGSGSGAVLPLVDLGGATTPSSTASREGCLSPASPGRRKGLNLLPAAAGVLLTGNMTVEWEQRQEAWQRGNTNLSDESGNQSPALFMLSTPNRNLSRRSSRNDAEGLGLLRLSRRNSRNDGEYTPPRGNAASPTAAVGGERGGPGGAGTPTRNSRHRADSVDSDADVGGSSARIRSGRHRADSVGSDADVGGSNARIRSGRHRADSVGSDTDDITQAPPSSISSSSTNAAIAGGVGSVAAVGSPADGSPRIFSSARGVSDRGRSNSPAQVGAYAGASGGAGGQGSSTRSSGRSSMQVDWDGQRLSFCVVDDSAANRKMAGRLLSNYGHTVQEVDGAAAFLALMQDMQGQQQRFDVILMDDNMPGMSGPEATRAVRDAGYRGLIVGVTGDTSTESVQRFQQHGANAVLPKPLKLDKLKQEIDQFHSIALNSTTL